VKVTNAAGCPQGDGIGIVVSGMKRGWGGASATARGTRDYADRTKGFRAPVHVRVSRIAACGVRRAYLRRTITFDRAADRRRWGRALGGTTDLTCPD